MAVTPSMRHGARSTRAPSARSHERHALLRPVPDANARRDPHGGLSRLADARFPTWLDRVPEPQDVRRASRTPHTSPDQAGYLNRAGGDAAVCAVAAARRPARGGRGAGDTSTAPAIAQAQFPWRGAYISCWSPRGAAEAAHDGADPTTLKALRQAQLHRPPGDRAGAGAGRP